MNLYLKKQLFLCNFIHNTGIGYCLQWRASALESFPIQPNPISLCRECIYNTSVLRLFSETNLRNCFQSQSCVNCIESGTIATFYKIRIRIMELGDAFSLSNSLTCSASMVDYECDASSPTRSMCNHRVQM